MNKKWFGTKTVNIKHVNVQKSLGLGLNLSFNIHNGNYFAAKAVNYY